MKSLVDLLQRDINRDPTEPLGGEDSHDLFSMWLFPASEEPISSASTEAEPRTPPSRSTAASAAHRTGPRASR